MNREPEFEPALTAEEQRTLTRLAERLEYERPVPSPAFRGELRRLLITPGRSPTRTRHHWALATSCIGLGFLCLAVAAAGLAGAGPFAAG